MILVCAYPGKYLLKGPLIYIPNTQFDPFAHMTFEEKLLEAQDGLLLTNKENDMDKAISRSMLPS